VPKPFDPRVLLWESYAVAKAAIESGVAQNKLDLDEYKKTLEKRLQNIKGRLAKAAAR
jgi:malate dehydrogenase (oxaloacetate-decarboxylating)(NADP+)